MLTVRPSFHRSSFLGAVLATIALVLTTFSPGHTQIPKAASKPNMTPLVQEVGKGVFVMRYFYLNSVFVITDEGVLVMETYSPFYANILKQEIAKRTDKAVKYVLYSHAHADHVQGASIFEDTAQFIAQARQIPRLKRFKNPTFPMPDVVFDKELKLNLGGKEIILRDYGVNHGTGVVVMHFPEDKIITAVDLAYMKRWRWYDMPDDSPKGIVASLREIQKLDFDLVITGHGPLATKAELIEHADFVEDLLTQINTIFQETSHAGKTPFEGIERAKKEVDTSKYMDWGFSEFRDLHIMGIYNAILYGY